MHYVNVTTIVIVTLIAIALIVFMILRNRKDKKELLKDDPVEDEIANQQRQKDKL
jgi:FtsZ-interacting cell division protein ZipA